MTPGARNTITDVPGLRIGAAQDERLRSGVTVVLGDRPLCGAVDIRGGGPGTRDTHALMPEGVAGEASCRGAVGRLGFRAGRGDRRAGLAARARSGLRGRASASADRAAGDSVRSA